MIWTSAEIPAMLRPYHGLTLLGAVDCGDCLEVVFSRPTDARKPNLLCLCADGRITHGGIADPETYVLDACWGAA